MKLVATGSSWVACSRSIAYLRPRRVRSWENSLFRWGTVCVRWTRRTGLSCRWWLRQCRQTRVYFDLMPFAQYVVYTPNFSIRLMIGQCSGGVGVLGRGPRPAMPNLHYNYHDSHFLPQYTFKRGSICNLCKHPMCLLARWMHPINLTRF